MAQPVRCEVCGKLFSSSHLGAHQRLAHSKLISNEAAAVKKILTLFETLSAEEKKKVLATLGVSQGKTD